MLHTSGYHLDKKPSKILKLLKKYLMSSLWKNILKMQAINAKYWHLSQDLHLRLEHINKSLYIVTSQWRGQNTKNVKVPFWQKTKQNKTEKKWPKQM